MAVHVSHTITAKFDLDGSYVVFPHEVGFRRNEEVARTTDARWNRGHSLFYLWSPFVEWASETKVNYALRPLGRAIAAVSTPIRHCSAAQRPQPSSRQQWDELIVAYFPAFCENVVIARGFSFVIVGLLQTRRYSVKEWE